MHSGAQIGVTVLAVTGRNLARDLARHGCSVAIHNRSVKSTTDLATAFANEGTFIPAASAQEMVAACSGRGV